MGLTPSDLLTVTLVVTFAVALGVAAYSRLVGWHSSRSQRSRQFVPAADEVFRMQNLQTGTDPECRLFQKFAELGHYGGRPGTLGLFRLMKAVVSHLAVTGSIAVGDTLLQQFVGHGLAGRISAKLGEGVVNGLMTARIGLSAMDVCRPLPFLAADRPRLKDLAGNLVTPAEADSAVTNR